MNQCVILGDKPDWQQRAEQAEALALTLQTQRDAAEAETAQALEALTIAREALEGTTRMMESYYTPTARVYAWMGDIISANNSALRMMKRAR